MAENRNPLLFNAHALATDSAEPHAQEGNHLRVASHPLLGLPVAPFIVSRSQIFLSKEGRWRKEAVFVTKRGTLAGLPFDVTDDNPLTAYISVAVDDHCIWAQVNADGLRAGDEPKLVCDAYMNSSLGPALVGRRSRKRYAFSGPSLTKIEISGEGRVTGIQWLADSDTKGLKFEPFAIMNLPHPGGLRYLAVTNARDFVEKRVRQQAPRRRPLQETMDAPSPASAPVADEIFEVDRVVSLSQTLPDDLDKLINDGSVAPLQQEVEEPVFDAQGRKIGTSKMKRMARVMQQQADHGTASQLGYKMMDQDWVGRDQQLVVYRVDGFFYDFPPSEKEDQMHQDQMAFDAVLAAIDIGYRSMSASQVIEQFFGGSAAIDSVKRNERIKETLDKKATYVSLSAHAIADIGAPLDQVEQVTITGTQQSSWIPLPAPQAVREIEVLLRGVRVAGLLAAGKRTPASASPSKFQALNKENNRGFHAPLVLSLDRGNGLQAPIAEPGSGFVADRTAAESNIRYFVAQQDRFGRWSEWTAVVAPPGVRPRPPRPLVQARYTMASIGGAPTAGGKVNVRVPVPEADTLAPGSHLLLKARILSKDLTTGLTQTFEDLVSNKASDDKVPVNANDPPQRFYVEHIFIGPLLQPTETRKLEISAFWIDTAGQISEESEKQTLRLNDPRPPPQLVVPDLLQYSARPDVTGLAWIEHRWRALAGQANFSVYYTDENRLRKHLEATGNQTVLNALNGAAHAAARATIYRNNAAEFPDHLFEKLRDVFQSFNSGEVGFRHGVSGSLRILNFYKIAAASASGATPVLTGLPLIVYGVPNSDPPPRPVVIVKPAAVTTGNALAADVTITVAPGTTRANMWRLKRTRGNAQNAIMMPVVQTGQLLPAASATEAQAVSLFDTGALQISSTLRLLPWVRYSWVAEAQGVPESGSVEAGQPVEGRWSLPSDPVSLILVPEAAPAALTVNVQSTPATGGFVNVSVSLSPASALLGGAFGSFRIRLERERPGHQPEVLHDTNADGAGPFAFSGLDPAIAGEVVPVGTRYVAILSDPLGRQSAPAIYVLM